MTGHRPYIEIDPLTLQCFASAWQLAGLAVVENGLAVQALEAVQRVIAQQAPPVGHGLGTGVETEVNRDGRGA